MGIKNLNIHPNTVNSVLENLGKRKLDDYIKLEVSELFLLFRDMLSLSGFVPITVSKELELEADKISLTKEIESLKKEIETINIPENK